jgi:LysM repeat protein
MFSRWKSLFLTLVCLFFVAFASISAQDQQLTHTVQSGDNLFRIALRYGVSMDALAQANGITGQVLIIPGLESVPAQTTENVSTVNNPLVSSTPVSHVVQRGETLAIIASQYRVTAQQILQANNIPNPNLIYSGQTLQIWTNDLSVPATVTDPATNAPVAEANIPQPVEAAPAPVSNEIFHTVRQGEYLSQIARDYGVSWTSIAEANGITNPDRIYSGLQLRIPNPNTVPASAPIGSALSDPSTFPNTPTARWGTGREIVVVLSTQMTYAFENGVLLKAVRVSTGLPATPTVQGDYKIYLRRDSQTMSGPGYYLPGVQWVQYFYQGYGLHGTYWHNNFGNPMSHGCVNMTNEDALWFYNFGTIGTPVHVRWA